MKKAIGFLLFVIVGVIVLNYLIKAATAPKYSAIITEPINPSVDPIQITVEDMTPIPIKFKDGDAELTPKAKYKIAAKVCGTKRYSEPWHALVAPYDLCLAWGRLATENFKDKLKYSQDMRWYQFVIHRDAPVDVNYVSTHSANVHVIFSDMNLIKTVSRFDEGDIIEMNGYLVFLKGKYKGYEIWWNSSLTREDTGDGSCELFYIKSIRKGKYLYGTLPERM